MIKSRGEGGQAAVTFTLDAAVGAQSASVCGDFNGWEPAEMERQGDGSFRLTVALAVGRRYRFRYLLDGNRWENDWAADEYVPNDFGGDDSLVDLTEMVEPVPATSGAGARPPVKAAAKRAGASSAPAKASAPAGAPPSKGVAKKAPAKKAAASTGHDKGIIEPAVPAPKPAASSTAKKATPAKSATAKKRAPKRPPS